MARNKKRTPKSKTPAASAVSAETLRLTQTKLELSYLREIVAKTATQPLSVQEQTDLSASLETLAWVMSLIENKNATLTRLRRALFGNGTESMEKLLATLLAGPSRQAQEEGRESVESPPPTRSWVGSSDRRRSRGLGRRCAGSLRRATGLDHCPGGRFGERAALTQWQAQ